VYWTKKLQEAERELGTAKRLADVRGRRGGLRIAKAELKLLDEDDRQKRRLMDDDD
jgi:hypothetical protein